MFGVAQNLLSISEKSHIWVNRLLILTRKIGESLKIGNEQGLLEEPITVTVRGVKGGQVRIGVSAPSDVRVDRSEVRDRIEQEVQVTASATRKD